MSANLEGRVKQLELELAESQRRLQFTREWCLSKMQRLRILAESLPEDKREQYIRILAEAPPPL